MKKIENIAHRGASAVCPENTMVAFERSLELGASGIETDVQLSSDGTLVLIHDETLSRTLEQKAGLRINRLKNCVHLTQALGSMLILLENVFHLWMNYLIWFEAKTFYLTWN